MARKVIDYQDWQRTRSLVEARARRILSFFDVDKLRRKPRDNDRETWLQAHGQASRYEQTEPRAKVR